MHPLITAIIDETRPRSPHRSARAWLEQHLAAEHDPGPCIDWPYARTGTGHAVYSGTTVARIILGLERYDGLVARHTCDRPQCVNPHHLERGTYQDNSDDMKARGRHRSTGGALSRRP